MNTDLIIVGAGPGGYRAAEHAAKHGLRVVIFEEQQVGGTCLNEGCIPTKAFARHAELMLALRDAGQWGLRELHYDFDFSQEVARKDEVLATLRGGVETLLGQPGITLVRERAAFVDAHTVRAIECGQQFSAPHILVATGSVPRLLALQQGDCHGVARDSEWLLRHDRLPRHLCVVGAGVIGMEFASIYSAFGVQVTVIEFLKECLPTLDADIAKRLRKVLEKRGVTFLMQSAVMGMERMAGDGSVQVTYERKGKTECVVADEVLMAVGRRPRVSDDFALAGFEYSERSGVTVNEHLQTTVPHIYAIGDVNGKQMLAHAAEMQALHAVNHLLGLSDDICFDVMPAAIFTHPEAACVGLSEEQCKALSEGYECRKAFYRANGKALAMNETEGMLKLLSLPQQGRIVGCHVYGAHAADLVQEVSALMCRQTTVAQLRNMVHIHPTLSEIVLTAAEQ